MEIENAKTSTIYSIYSLSDLRDLSNGSNLLMKSIAFLLVLFLTFNVDASTMIVKNSSLVISGILDESDNDKFDSFIHDNPKITTIIFDNCMGGIVSIGFKISQLILKKQLDTIASHECHSSCAYAFLAGKTRRFDSSRGVHAILLHLGRNADPKNDVSPYVNPALMRYITSLTDNKLTSSIKYLIEKSTLPSQGVVFISNNGLFFNNEKTVYCDGSQHDDIRKCKLLVDATATSLGITTSD